MTAETESMDLGDDIANAFLTNLIGNEVEKEKPAPEADEDDLKPSKADDESAEDDAETSEEDAETEEADPDDDEVDLGENTKAKLRDLKSAYKLQAETNVAREQAMALRAQAEAQASVAKAAIERALEKARAKWEPYSKLDFLSLSRDQTIDQATFETIRKEAAEALADYKFHSEELGGVVTAQQNQAKQQSTAEAAATVAALSNPETGIKGWNQQLYNDMLAYAEKAGAPRTVATSLTAEWAIRALHKAMLYDQGVANTQSKLAKVVNKPTRTLGTAKGDGKVAPGSATKSAMATLRRTGDVDDAANAFFASFGVED